MALSVGNLLTKHFLLTVNMSLVTLFMVGLLVPSILSLPHFVKRQVEATDGSTTAPSATTMVIVETTTSNDDLGGTTEALTTTEGLPAETTESSMTTEGEPIETTQSSMTTEMEPIETTESSMTTEVEPIETTESSMTTEGVPIETTESSLATEEPMGTTESMTTTESPTDTTESSTAVVEVEGSTAVIVIPIDILSNLTEITTETELMTAMTTSMRKKRSVLDKDSAENSNSAESGEISSKSTEDNESSATSEEKDDSEISETKGDSTEEVTEPEELENSAFSRPQGPPSELFTPLTNRLPFVGVLPSLTVGDSGFLAPIIRQPAKPQVTEVFHDLPTDGETGHFDTAGIGFNQESGFDAVNCGPQFTDKVNYENLQISEDPDVYFFNTIFYNFFEKLQNMIYELKARKTVDSKRNMHKHDHEKILENENSFMRQPNHYPSSTKDHLVTLKLILGLTEKESRRDIRSTYHGEEEVFYNV